MQTFSEKDIKHVELDWSIYKKSDQNDNDTYIRTRKNSLDAHTYIDWEKTKALLDTTKERNALKWARMTNDPSKIYKETCLNFAYSDH